MSTDLKIELFGKDLFNFMWKYHGFRDGPPRSKRPSAEFNEKVFRAVQARQAMFYHSYEETFDSTYGDFAGHSTDFFDTIVLQFPHYFDWDNYPSPEMVMSLFLYSCAFVADMTMYTHVREDKFLDVAPKAWAMFVDMYLKEKFYEYGGWKRLRKFVEQDVVFHDYMMEFSKEEDNYLGGSVMDHMTHLTCGAVESFDEFEAWEGVDDAAPLAMKWVDYCVHVPFMNIRTLGYFRDPVPGVIQKLENVVLDLRYILDPDREGDYFDKSSNTTESLPGSSRASPRHSLRRQSRCKTEDTSGFPMAPVFRFPAAPGNEEHPFSRWDGVDLRASNPNNVFKVPKPPVDSKRLEKMIGDKKAAETPEIATEKVKPGERSDVADRKKGDQAGNAGALQSPSKKQTHSKPEMTLKASNHEDNQSSTSSKNECPTEQISTSLSDNEMDLDTSLEESLLSVALVITSSDRNDAQPKMNTGPNDFEIVMDQLGLELFSEYASTNSKRRVEVYLKTDDLDNMAVLNESLEDSPVKSSLPNVSDMSTPRKSPLTSPNVKVLIASRKSPLKSPNVSVLSTPRKSPLTSPNVRILSSSRKSPPKSPNGTILSSPRKSPLTSPNVNTLNTSRKSPLKTPNVSVLSNPRKSPLKSPNVTVLSSPRKSPLTSPNVIVFSSPRKSPLTSPNVIVLSSPRKSPLTSPNVIVLSSPRKSPLTSSNVSVSITPDGMLYKRINTSGLSGSSRKSPNSKENSPSTKSKAEIKKKSPHQKNAEIHSTSPNSIDNADIQKIKRSKRGKCLVKELPSHLYLDIEDPSKDEKKILSDGKATVPTPVPDKGVEKDTTNILKSVLKPTSSDPMWGCLDVPHQSSVLDDEENDHILEESLKQIEPVSKRPSKENGCGLGDRRISQKVTKGQSSSADPPVDNQLKLAPGAGETKNNAKIKLDCGKSSKTEKETTSADSRDENPFGFDAASEKAKLKHEPNSCDSNSDALLTSSQSENTTAEPTSENPFDFSSAPQDAEKKAKKRRQKKRPTRLEQRVKEEGDGVHDVLRLIFVMGHQPGMASVAAAFRKSKKANS